MRLNQGVCGLIASTYLGGSGTDNVNYSAGSIDVDAAGNAYVTGTTESADFPTVGAAQGYGGNTDAFVTRLAMEGTADCALVFVPVVHR